MNVVFLPFRIPFPMFENSEIPFPKTFKSLAASGRLMLPGRFAGYLLFGFPTLIFASRLAAIARCDSFECR